jgi:hypothetical protein
MYGYAKMIICIAVCAALISCASGTAALKDNWGKIVPDDQVRNSFESYQISADLDYFISGSDVYPFAILGLNKAYALDSDLWKKIELTPAMLQELVLSMKSRAMNFGQNQFGFAVLDDRGKQIGVWYSILFAATSVQMKGENKVMIYTPAPDSYKKNEEKSLRHIH